MPKYRMNLYYRSIIIFYMTICYVIMLDDYAFYNILYDYIHVIFYLTVARSFIFYVMFYRSLFVLLTIVLSLLRRNTDSDYLFGIFKLFAYDNVLCNIAYDYVFSMQFLSVRCLCYFHDYAFYNIFMPTFSKTFLGIRFS